MVRIKRIQIIVHACAYLHPFAQLPGPVQREREREETQKDGLKANSAGYITQVKIVMLPHTSRLFALVKNLWTLNLNVLLLNLVRIVK